MPHDFSIRNMVSNLTRPVAHKVLTEALIIVSEYNLQKRQFNEIPKHNLKLISIREKEDINYYSNKYKNESAKKNAEHAWINMMSRCYNENSASYYSYGGRGIIVCDEFKNKNNFIKYCVKNLGKKPKPYYVIDRIDNNDIYKPGNIRWAHPKISGCNKNNIIVQEYHRYIASFLYKYYNIKQVKILDIFEQRGWILRHPRSLQQSFSTIIRNELVNV